MPKNYDEWKKTIAEMGLEDLSDKRINPFRMKNPLMMVGDYRDHHIKIYEATLRSGGGPESDETIRETTYYDVEFENPQEIMMDIKKRFSIFSRSISISLNLHSPPQKIMTDIKIDSEFDKKFSVKGNNETVIRAILDPSIRNEIAKIRDFSLVIGVDKLMDLRVTSQLQNWGWDLGSVISTISSARALQSRIRKGIESRYETNMAQHIDSQSLLKTKQEPERFRAIIDVMTLRR